LELVRSFWSVVLSDFLTAFLGTFV
jgi:hypothetical protein